jgi:hypothetical protein
MALGILMPLVAVATLLAWWRGWLSRRSWYLVLGLQLVLVASGVLALRSGEADEERVERIVPEQALETHERAAEAFVWATAAVLVLMGAATALGERSSARRVATAATLGTLVVLGLGYRTGKAGGELVYRHGAYRAYTTGGKAAVESREASPTESRGGDDD